MPIIKSAIKRMRQTAKRRSHNLQVKRAIHRDIRTFGDAVASGDSSKISEALKEAVSEIDRAVKKGTLHRNTAARRKSQLQKQANTVAGEKPAPKAAAKKTPTRKAAAKKPAAKPKPKTAS